MASARACHNNIIIMNLIIWNQATIIIIGFRVSWCVIFFGFVGFDDNEPGDSDEEGNEKELTLQTTKKTSGNPFFDPSHPVQKHDIIFVRLYSPKDPAYN